MSSLRLSQITLALTFLLITAGALVHTTGSALACPDWPLCYGSPLPPMEGGILYEHSHRLIATAVALLTLILSLRLVAELPSSQGRKLGYAALGAGFLQACTLILAGWLTSRAQARGEAAEGIALLLVLSGLLGAALLAAAWRSFREGQQSTALALLLSELVIFQAGLGGLTVLMRLPTIVSTTHLAVSLLYLAALIALIVRLQKQNAATSTQAIFAGRSWITWTTLALYAQMLLGASVRHTGAGLACNVDLLHCNGAPWPTSGPEILLWSHRSFALFIVGMVLMTAHLAFRNAKRSGQGALRAWALLLATGVLVQLVLGALTVVTYISVNTATAHLVVGALLLALMIALWLQTHAPPSEQNSSNSLSTSPRPAQVRSL